jgi:ferredoxin
MRSSSTVTTTLAASLLLLDILGCSGFAATSPNSSFDRTTTKNVATQVLQGTGPTQVDLNKYNLKSLEQIEQEWTANLVQKIDEQEITVRLGTKSDKELFVDTVQVTFPRRKNAGVGLQLVELAGGRDDGLGITVISGLVPGGSAAQGPEASNILPGDSIAQVAVVRQKKSDSGGVLAETREEFVTDTECFSYDSMVEAIQSLPLPNEKYEEFYALILKRIRQKPKVTINLQYPPEQNEPDATIQLFAGENLRHGMLVRGVKLNDPLAKRFDTKNDGNCGASGLCRTCAVTVLKGGELLNPQRLAEKQMLADSPRWRLACKAIVGYGMQEGEMTIRVNPRQW